MNGAFTNVFAVNVNVVAQRALIREVKGVKVSDNLDVDPVPNEVIRTDKE